MARNPNARSRDMLISLAVIAIPILVVVALAAATAALIRAFTG